MEHSNEEENRRGNLEVGTSQGNLHNLSWRQDGASATVRNEREKFMSATHPATSGEGHLPPSLGLSSCSAHSRLFLSEREREATQLRAPSSVSSFFRREERLWR